VKLVIVGGVAGRASAAARARRLAEDAEIVLIERGPDVSYANCGLPYHVGGVIPDRTKLLVVTPKLLRERFRLDVRTRSSVERIDRAAKTVTRLMAKEVGRDGQVFAVDIAPKFLEHVQKTSRDAGLKNVTPVLCGPDSVDLPPNAVDLAFICDTYHHFEFPERTLLSLHRAVKPGGWVVVVDFHRVQGKSSDWTLKHVRAGQEVFEKEIVSAGFEKTDEVKDLLKDNYFMVFTKPAAGRK
jgi:SAM-dependent methyltransferase